MKKVSNIIFSIVFLALLVLPFCFTNFEKDVTSEIEKEKLPEISTSSFKSFVNSASKYLDKRIGFRQDTIDLYQELNDTVFARLEHPLYMSGSWGHLYYKDDEVYIKDYQHLNLNEEWANGFAEGIKSFQDYAESKDKTFLYMALPDKKTVYPEYFPEGYNINGDVSRTDQVLCALDENGVNYYWAKNTMLEGKKDMLVNNKKYDVTHWNENGAFLVLAQMYELLRQDNPALDPLSKEDYTVTTEIKEKLPESNITINEEVPLYTLKNNTSILHKNWHIDNEILFPKDSPSYFSRHTNPEKADAPKILVIHDSYLAEKEKFFKGNFSEVIFLHRYNIHNLDWFKYYVDLFDPDIIIYENPERSWPIDLHKETAVPGKTKDEE